MKKTIICFTICSCLTGCASLHLADHSYRYEQQKNLSKAVEMIRKGDTASANILLAAICNGRGVPGITDEALFRYSLLNTKAGNVEKLRTLERLLKGYPTSLWARMAKPIVDMLGQNNELREQNRGLKNANQSLSREKRELLQTLERLKHLDLDLERKNN